MSHVDEGQLHAWLDGEFAATGQDEAAFEAHIENCALCLGRLERARTEREEADRILGLASPRVVDPPPFEALVARRDPRAPARRAGTRRAGVAMVALGWAATVVLALGIGWVARGAVTPSGSQVVAMADEDVSESIFAEGDLERPEAVEAVAEPLPPAAPGALPPVAGTTAVAEPADLPAPPVAGSAVGAAQRARSFTPPLDRIQADAAVAERAVEPEVGVEVTPNGVRIENGRANRIVYLVMDSDVAARARWVPCASADCAGVDPGDATQVSSASVPNWRESPTLLVFWWHLVPGPENGLVPDSIRSIPVPYQDG